MNAPSMSACPSDCRVENRCALFPIFTRLLTIPLFDTWESRLLRSAQDQPRGILRGRLVQLGAQRFGSAQDLLWLHHARAFRRDSGRQRQSCHFVPTADNTVAISAGALPACAAGVDPHKLEVVGAQADQQRPALLTVSFNLPVDKKSAEEISHYSLKPACAIQSAVVSADDAAQVHLTAALEDDTSYVLTVSQVTTPDGSNLNAKKTTAQFKTGNDQ